MQNNIIPILLVSTTVALNTVAQALLKLGAGQGLLNLHLLGGCWLTA
jgi:small multidrug resistance pump